MSVVWITGVSCSGKSTLVKNIINQFDNFQICKPVGKIRCTKFDDLLVVGGTYTKKVNSPGLDGDSRGSRVKRNNNFKELINREYPKYENILCETRTPAFFNKDILYWLIDTHKLQIFYLTTEKGILDDRAKNRKGKNNKQNFWDRKRTDKRTMKEFSSLEILISDEKISKYTKELRNDNIEDSMKNTKTICEFMGV